MTKMNSTIRRSTAALLLAMGMLAFAAPGASAEPLHDSTADATALKIFLKVPSSDQLKATLKEVGLDVSAIPAGLLPATSLEIDISTDHGDVSLNGSKGYATVVAVSLNGSPVLNKSVTSHCSQDISTKKVTDCNSDAPIALLGPITLPNGLGSIEIAGAKSTSADPKSTDSATSLVKVHLDLRELFKTTLAPLAGPIGTATGTVNTSVLAPVNGVLKTVEAAIPADTIPGVSLGTIKDIPSIATAPLLDLTVLPGGTTITSDAKTEELTSKAVSEIEDLSVLGGYVGLKTVTANAAVSGALPIATSDTSLKQIRTTAETNLKAAQAMVAAENKKILAAAHLLKPATADHSLVVGGGSIAGLVNLDLDKFIAQFRGLAPIVSKLIPANAATDAAKAELVAAAQLADYISGIKFDRLAGAKTLKQGTGREALLSLTRSGSAIHIGSQEESSRTVAQAVSEQLVLNVAPTLPKLSSITAHAPAAGAIVPRLTANDFVASGVVLRVEMPKAAASLGGATVFGNQIAKARTGVGTHTLAALFLIGAAIVVKKYALSNK